MSADGDPVSAPTEEDPIPKWELFLYIAGMTSVARRAIDNLSSVCEKHLRGVYTLEVVDILEQPSAAESAQIVATPTLVRRLPTPLRKIIGDLSNSDKLLAGLEIRPTAT